MAQNKFEKHIKEQLEKREIKPSPNAWEKLAEKLDTTAIPQQKTMGYFWYAAAASIVIAIVTAFQFFSTTADVRVNTPQTVSVPELTVEKEVQSTEPKQAKTSEKVAVVTPPKKKATPITVPVRTKKPIVESIIAEEEVATTMNKNSTDEISEEIEVKITIRKKSIRQRQFYKCRNAIGRCRI